MNELQEAPTTSDVVVDGGEHQAGEQVREPSQWEVAEMIADRLAETEAGVRTQITSIVKALGRTQARALLEETLRVENNGGMMLPDGSRRRTPGGVFFSLVYTKGQPKPGKMLPRRAAPVPGNGRKQHLPKPVKSLDQPSASLPPVAGL